MRLSINSRPAITACASLLGKLVSSIRSLLLFLCCVATLASAAPRQLSLQIELSTGERVDYLFYEPQQASDGEVLPLLLFLHGGGESGDGLEKVKTHGPPREIEEGREFPMFVVSPLNPDAKGFWDEDRLSRFLDALQEKVEFDKARVYLAGMSRGGYGAYRLAMENPDRFAAMIVLCGAAPSPYANWLGDLPVWMIHGEKDKSIPVAESVRMEKAIREVGGNVRLTLYPEAGHDVWTRTFQDPKTINWLLSHRRGGESVVEFEDVLITFGETQAALKRAGKGIQQFSVAQPNGKRFHAESVQNTYVARLLDNDKLAGIKGAVVGKRGQDAFGIEGPLSATLFQSGWHLSKNQPVIEIREGENPGIETELGIILSKPITKELADIAALKEHIEALVPVIELPSGKMDWSEKPRAVDLIAANVGSDNYIVGEKYTDLSIDLDALPVQLFAGDKIINETSGGAANRGQWWNFLHQVNWAVKQGYELKPGNLVITGALGKIRKDGVGSYRATFGDLGEIRFSLK